MRIYVINIEAYKGKDRAKIPYFALISYYLVSFAALRVYFAKWRLQFSHLPKVTIRKSDIFCVFSSFFFRKSFVGSGNVCTFAVQSRNKGCLIGTEESIFYVLWSTRGYRRYISVRRKTVPLVTLYALGASLTCLHY